MHSKPLCQRSAVRGTAGLSPWGDTGEAAPHPCSPEGTPGSLVSEDLVSGDIIPCHGLSPAVTMFPRGKWHLPVHVQMRTHTHCLETLCPIVLGDELSESSAHVGTAPKPPLCPPPRLWHLGGASFPLSCLPTWLLSETPSGGTEMQTQLMRKRPGVHVWVDAHPHPMQKVHPSSRSHQPWETRVFPSRAPATRLARPAAPRPSHGHTGSRAAPRGCARSLFVFSQGPRRFPSRSFPLSPLAFAAGKLRFPGDSTTGRLRAPPPPPGLPVHTQVIRSAARAEEVRWRTGSGEGAHSALVLSHPSCLRRQPSGQVVGLLPWA